jgi:hypothetical protein
MVLEANAVALALRAGLRSQPLKPDRFGTPLLFMLRPVGLLLRGAFLLLAVPPTPNTLYHLIDRDVFKFALPDNPSATANRSPYPWIGRTEQRNRWTAEIGGQVRDPGIVADIGAAAAEMVKDFRKAQIFKHANASPFGRGRAKPRSASPKGRSLNKSGG